MPWSFQCNGEERGKGAHDHPDGGLFNNRGPSQANAQRRERMTPKEVIKFAKEKGAKIVDLRFIDMPGLWQHFSLSVAELNEGLFEEGIGFDGSSIRGFQHIHESDMLLVPDPATAAMDPSLSVPTLVLLQIVHGDLAIADLSGAGRLHGRLDRLVGHLV